MATNNKKRTRSKSSLSSARPRSYSDLYKNDNTVSVPTTATAAVSRTPEPRYAAAKSTETVDLKSQYAYVINDLRLLLIVSAVLVGIIFVAKLFT